MIYRTIALGLVTVGIAVLAQGSQAQTAPNGQQLFQQRCAVCHSTTAGASAMVGPNLAGVVGRKAGTTTFAYSPALKNSKVVWTRAQLDRYLTNPGKMIPGGRMAVSVPDAAQRAAVIDFLTTKR
jgi:cytochrome c